MSESGAVQKDLQEIVISFRRWLGWNWRMLGTTSASVHIFIVLLLLAATLRSTAMHAAKAAQYCSKNDHDADSDHVGGERKL